jgi:hypothetical protein
LPHVPRLTDVGLARVESHPAEADGAAVAAEAERIAAMLRGAFAYLTAAPEQLPAQLRPESLHALVLADG